jgi:chitinase
MQSTGPYDPARSYELAELAEGPDFINLMTYDMGTSFSAVSSFNAPLNEVAEDPLPSRCGAGTTVALDLLHTNP